jgi:type I restriction enzyme S subunit
MRINSGMVLLRKHGNTIDQKYIYKLFASNVIQKQIVIIAFGSAQPQLTVKGINNLKVPLPPIKEQIQIANILSTADKKLEVLRAKKEKYETLKQGLMQKLLTGEVRVV